MVMDELKVGTRPRTRSFSSPLLCLLFLWNGNDLVAYLALVQIKTQSVFSFFLSSFLLGFLFHSIFSLNMPQQFDTVFL